MDYYVIHEYSSNESERGTGNPLFDDRCVSRILLSLHRCGPYEEGFIYRVGRIFTMDLATGRDYCYGYVRREVRQLLGDYSLFLTSVVNNLVTLATMLPGIPPFLVIMCLHVMTLVLSNFNQ